MIIEVFSKHLKGTPKAEEILLLFVDGSKHHEVSMERTAAHELHKKLGEALFQTA